MRFKIFLIFILAVFNVYAIDCNLMKHLADPKLADNLKFWEEYGTLSNSGKLNDRTLKDLLKKHTAEPPEVQVAAKTAPREPINYSSTKKADKEISQLSPVLKKHYEEFMTLMSDKSGLQQLYANPGRWHMEKIKAKADHYTVRLNGGVRVLFKMEKNEISIIEVNAAKIHAI